MPKTKLQILAEQAIDRNQEALEYLQLTETTLVGSKNNAVTWETLCSNYNYCAHVYIVAAKLGLHILRRKSCMAPRHMNWIARHHYRCEFPKPMEKNQKGRNGGDPEPPREDPVSHAWLRSRGMGHQMPSQGPCQER